MAWGEAAGGAAAWVDAPSLAVARDRIGVYRRMYATRLAREVAREYPATRALLGAAHFDAVARAFATSRRSRSFTLEGYAADLPIFLKRSRTPGDHALRAAAAALARYERARAQALRAPAALRGVRPGRLIHADGARLLVFDFDVETGFARFARSQVLRTLRRRRTLVAIFRREGVAVALRVAPREAALLRELLRGEPIEAAVALASDGGLRPAGIRAALEHWVGAGLLRAHGAGA
jgi:hypothetical protein